ncbi:hypothetical protein [Sandaracinus amylolyticus]|uniref:Response regulatory domain-containing protein n=1 Tax=Sandaracinus amylolyticus TaxID=927083 RepID=A0A0F6YHZ6_9BACT|nr:hypothetical protein [Sandaracinus amylolyticus]AKF04520.1 hypothetical protein DB32_001669 [Sandaracinus amylolyticus]
MPSRIDLVDPGPDGEALAAGLRAAGFDVALRAMPEVPRTQADALVLAGDAPSALETLRALRDDGVSPDTPVVLLGTPLGTAHRGEGGAGFGAQAVLLRPIALGALVDTLSRVLAPPEEPGSDTSQHRARGERTLELEARTGESIYPRDLDAREVGRDDDELPALASVAPMIPMTPWRQERTPSSSSGSTSSGGTTGDGSSAGVIRGPTAAISERLRLLLEAADRRVFPGRPPVDLSLPGGDEPAIELVPAHLLEGDDFTAPPVATQQSDDDPIDAFTFVGGPVLPSASGLIAELPPPPRAPSASEPPPVPDGEDAPPPKTAPGTPTSLSKRPPPRREPTVPPRASEPPGTGVHSRRVSSMAPMMPEREWPAEDSVLGRATPEGGRRGALGDGGALRLLLRIAELRLDAQVTITPSSGEALAMTLVAGEVARIETPVARGAAAILRRRGAGVGLADDEASAVRALDDAQERGAITRFERARAMREAHLERLRAVVALERGSFVLTRLEPNELPPPAPSPLGAPLRLALLDAARRGLDASRARAVLGGLVTLRRGPRFDALAIEGLIAPELAELLAQHEGASPERLVAAAPDEPGLHGVVCALVAAGALVAQPALELDVARDEHRRLARRLIEEAARTAEDADYFTILGVAHDATARDLDRAHTARRDQLLALALEDLDLSSLEALRRGALESLEEAYRVLSDPRWREAYARALSHTERLATTVGEH